MIYSIEGKGFSTLLTVEDGTVKAVDNESISVFIGENWDHSRSRMERYGWKVEEVPEISVYDVVTPDDTTFICHTPSTIEACWPFPGEVIDLGDTSTNS